MKIISARYLKIGLYLFTFLHFFIEYQFGEILVLSYAIITSIFIVVNGVKFHRKEKESIKLGEEIDYRSSHWFVIGLLLFLFVFLYYLMPLMNELDLFPEMNEKPKWSIALLLLLPQVVEFFTAIIFGEMKTAFYATEKGLLKTLEGNEEKEWNDFYRYKVIGERSMLRFQKKNLKYLIIKYDEGYFHENKEEIIAFLDKNLKRE